MILCSYAHSYASNISSFVSSVVVSVDSPFSSFSSSISHSSSSISHVSFFVSSFSSVVSSTTGFELPDFLLEEGNVAPVSGKTAVITLPFAQFVAVAPATVKKLAGIPASV